MHVGQNHQFSWGSGVATSAHFGHGNDKSRQLKFSEPRADRRPGRKATGGQSAGWVTVWKHLGWLHKGDGWSFSSFEGQVGNHWVNRVRIIFNACINEKKKKNVNKTKRQVGTREWRCMNARPRSMDLIPLAMGKYSKTKEVCDNQSSHSELMVAWGSVTLFCISA